MAASSIALIILGITVVLFFTEKIPLALTAMLAAIAMGIFGVIGWEDVFSGMSNSIIMFLIGCGIVGAAFFSTGLADRIGEAIMKMGDRLSLKLLILLLFIIGVLTSAVFNGVMIVAILFPIIDSIAQSSNGRITRKQLYLPTAVSTVFGSNLTIIGSTSMMLAVGLLEESSYGYTLSFFEPFLIGLPGVLAAFLIYASFGIKMQDKVFNFPEHALELDIVKEETDSSKGLTFHQWMTIIVTVLCILSIAFGFNYGAAGFIAAAALILCGCIDFEHAFKSVSWSVVFLVVGSLGIAKGLSASGASAIIADVTLKIFAFAANSPALMCMVVLFMATLLSNFMSNGATVSVVVPIALSIAETLGTSGIPFVLACGIGANISVATPICVTQITMSCAAGYRFHDLLKMGGFLNLVAYIVTAAALWAVYFI